MPVGFLAQPGCDAPVRAVVRTSRRPCVVERERVLCGRAPRAILARQTPSRSQRVRWPTRHSSSLPCPTPRTHIGLRQRGGLRLR